MGSSVHTHPRGMICRVLTVSKATKGPLLPIVCGMVDKVVSCLVTMGLVCELSVVVQQSLANALILSLTS